MMVRTQVRMSEFELDTEMQQAPVLKVRSRYAGKYAVESAYHWRQTAGLHRRSAHRGAQGSAQLGVRTNEREVGTREGREKQKDSAGIDGEHPHSE